MLNFKDFFWGENGFEELKKYMKGSNEFCRELANIFSERSEIEITYSKSLSKNGIRLQKLSKELIGDLSDAWFQISLQFDSEAEMHKSFSYILQEEIIKPLKNLYENQAKSRKPIELNVERAIKTLADSRAKDYKYRMRCFKTVKDIESTMYSLDEAKKTINGKPPKQKEIQKLEDNLQNFNKLLNISETKYHKACEFVEVARQDWQLSMYKGCEQLQAIEEERINSLDTILKKYSNQINESIKKLSKMLENLLKIEINIKKDIEIIINKYGTFQNEQEIYLIDLYSENTNNMMNRERRISNLNKWLKLVSSEFQAQDKIIEGIEKVRNFNKQNPNFGSNEDELIQKIQSIKLVKLLYEACIFKIDMSLAEILDKPKPKIIEINNYLNNITINYDKFGIPISVLKLSPKNEELTIVYNRNNNFFCKSSEQFLNNQNVNTYVTTSFLQKPPSVLTSLYSTIKESNLEYLPSYESNISIQSKSIIDKSPSNENLDDDEWNEKTWISKCIVQYEYKNEREDELFLKLGEIIKIMEKRSDGWWRGETNGKIGLFPSTYVKELDEN